MYKKTLLITMIFALAIAGIGMGSAKGLPNRETVPDVSISQSVSLAATVSVSVERALLPITDSITSEIIQELQNATEDFYSKITTYDDNSLVNPEWSWASVGISLAILAVPIGLIYRKKILCLSQLPQPFHLGTYKLA